MKPFRIWMLKATTAEQEELASAAGLSRGYLYHIADGLRDASSAAAGRLADAAENIRKQSKGRLPKISRAHVSTVCGECEYAQRCLKMKTR